MTGTRRIVIFTIGTEGDARPYAALGRGLADCGHDVTLATSREFKPLVLEHNLKFAPLTADFLEMMRRNKSVMDQRHQVAMLRMLMAETRRMAKAWAHEALDAANGADLVIGSGNVSLLAASVAEKLSIPFVRSQLQPFDPSRSLPPVLFRPPSKPLPGWINLAVHRILRVMVWRFMKRSVDGVRRDLGLAPYPWVGPWALPLGAGGNILYGFSRHVVPRQSEWPDRIAIPGFFSNDRGAAFQPSEPLTRFLADGPKPIYIGFGSMVTERSAEMVAVIVDAVRATGRRAVIASGWADLASAAGNSDYLFFIQNVPHAWLFPRVALAVHHCGAGTSGAAMRAGIPTIPVPFVGDQFFWAWQMKRIGVATPPLNRIGLKANQLADAIDEASGTAMVDAAARLGEKLCGENGVAAAIAQLQAWSLLPAPGVAVSVRQPELLTEPL
ncbi:glycosyltransferase family 1 protein [Lichenicola cladoniae]|uniref:Glycosyltransferase family 1 protein n=1 Tax=Lichenicola cladoniae TaxID=1484109 RepID=A0A6M8HRE5_9PROT|nr:glycosyltransferase [Lichenicola cladoniae]NPD68730.1 glycosyltransferase family 1 protein [Acetobacteraceae bacterium]QKE90837.1 glycosyltransferase family 1 protein [Lichenicola cladoniae]